MSGASGLTSVAQGLVAGVAVGLVLVALAARQKPRPRPAEVVAAPPQGGGNPVEEAARMVEESSPEMTAWASADADPVAVGTLSVACPACLCACSEQLDVRSMTWPGRGNLCVTHDARLRVLADNGVDLDEFEARLRTFVRTPGGG